jgi:hypothetical protein
VASIELLRTLAAVADPDASDGRGSWYRRSMSIDDGVTLVRDVQELLGWLRTAAVMLLVAGLCVLALPYLGWVANAGAVAYGGVGVICGFMALRFHGVGPCPCCGGIIRSVQLGAKAQACPHCRAYVRTKGKRMFRLPDDYVASYPLFAYALSPGETVVFPDLCVRCGAPAAQVLLPAQARLSFPSLTSAPLCSMHALKPRFSGAMFCNGRSVYICSYRTYRALAGVAAHDTRDEMS